MPPVRHHAERRVHAAKWIKRAGMSQAAAAKAIGVSRAFMSILLKGRQPFPDRRISELGKALGASSEEIAAALTAPQPPTPFTSNPLPPEALAIIREAADIVENRIRARPDDGELILAALRGMKSAKGIAEAFLEETRKRIGDS